MTTIDVPHRLEFSIELPGTPEQVWQAIATADGLSAWYLTTELEERVGGRITIYMGPDDPVTGEITGWAPGERLAYEEPGWAALFGHEGEPATPLASEFLIEAASGGTCVLRVVSSAFGTGADWEAEFFAEMERYWVPEFERLRLYLTHFPGQRVTPLDAGTTLPGRRADVLAAARRSLAADEVGGAIDVHGVTGEVARLGEHDVMLRLTSPVAGFLTVRVFGSGDSSVDHAQPGDESPTPVSLHGHLFGAGAADYVAREQPRWQSWLESLALHGDVRRVSRGVSG